MAANTNHTTKKEQESILLSLEYLSREAKESGSDELHGIIKSAIALAVNEEALGDILHEFAHRLGAEGEDRTAILEFLLLFLQADIETKREVLSVVEFMETDELEVDLHRLRN